MTPEEAFLEDIREHPHEDAPRLIFADWLEDHSQADRAEFIRIQIERSHWDRDSPRALELRRRAEQLLQTHWDVWVRPLARVVGIEPGERWLQGGYRPEALAQFERGFVSFLDLHTRRFLDHTEELFRLAPIRHLRLRRAGDVAAELAACPYLRYLEGLEFIDYYSSPLDAHGMVHLAHSHHLSRLQYLGLYSNNLGDDGTIALSTAPWLKGLRVLELGDNGLSHRGMVALSNPRHPFRPIRLRLGGNYPGAEGVRYLVRSPILENLVVLALDSCQLDAESMAILAESTSFASLDYLDLDYNPLGDDGGILLASAPWLSQLSSLSVRGCGLSPAVEQQLTNRRRGVLL